MSGLKPQRMSFIVFIFFTKLPAHLCHQNSIMIHESYTQVFHTGFFGRGIDPKLYQVENFIMTGPKKLYKGMDEIIGFYSTNQNTLYLLHLFSSDNEIITVCSRPAICILMGWFKSSCLFISLSVSVSKSRLEAVPSILLAPA